MAQVGRIGGGVLKDNLERQGVDLAFETDLLYLKVSPELAGTDPLEDGDPNYSLGAGNRGSITQGIGINTNAPSDALTLVSPLKTTNLQVDTYMNLGSFEFVDSSINQLIDPTITLDSAVDIFATSISTDDIKIDDNVISTTTENTNLEIRPNGSGVVNIRSDWNITGDLYATGTIQTIGDVTIGDSDADTISFNADTVGNIVPADGTRSLGAPDKRWLNLYSNLLNGQATYVDEIIVESSAISRRQGNIYYVSTLGDDTNVGDHQHGAFRTLKHALAVMDASTLGPVTIHIYPGEYEEEFPLVVPENVSISGEDLRNVIIKPASGYNTNNAFELNQNTTIENITVTDFYSPGYAFVFAPGAIINERSPYIRNVTVITKGTNQYEPVSETLEGSGATDVVVTDTYDGGGASAVVTETLEGFLEITDTRGFDAGDAGGGAYIDGSVLDASTTEGSMLFHSATFITPGVDCITMTNGVRVEWLNSFTYFANRGLYATQGLLGLGSNGTRYGAEIRSIGSASVYGNYGAVADGADTLMYLIGHNFAYIGTGKDKSNDRTLTIESQQVTELNSGKIYYTSTDADGKFKVGSEFYVDFETGSTSIDASGIDFSGIGSITVRNGNEITYIDGERVDTGNIRINGNTVTTIDGDLNLSPATEIFNTDNNASLILSNGTDIQRNNLEADIRYNTESNLYEGYSSGNLSFGGIYSSDRLTSVDAHDTNNTLIFRVDGTQVGTIDSDSTNLHGLSTGDILFDNNVATTTLSNSDLELRRATLTNVVNVFDFDIKDSNFSNTSNNTLSLYTTNRGYVKFAGNTGMVIPYGNTAQQSSTPEPGETRWNTDQGWLETWNGEAWQRSAGEGQEVTDEILKELVDIYTIVLG
jgi:hypothetical protein